MKANELRIGNWVMYSTVLKINAHKILECAEHPERFAGIPLTEEWHNKFGCVQNGFDSFEYILPRKNNIRVKVIFTREYVMLRQGAGNSEDDIVSIWNKDVTRRDICVHEWQNIYFALTGEELTLIEKP